MGPLGRRLRAPEEARDLRVAERAAEGEKARRDFEVLSKTDGSIAGDNDEQLQSMARRAIRLYAQVAAMVGARAKSGPTLATALIHRRLGNLHAAVECLEVVIDLDPTVRKEI